MMREIKEVDDINRPRIFSLNDSYGRYLITLGKRNKPFLFPRRFTK